MKKKKTAIVLAIAILLIVGVVWAWNLGPDPQVKKVQELGKGLFADNEPPNREKMDQFRKEMDQLSPEQRREAMQPMREQMERRMNKTIDDYFALPSNRRKPYLDKQIQEEEKRRKEWEKRRQEREANRGPAGQGQNRGGPPGQGPFPGGMGPNQAPPGPGNANRGGPGGRRNSTPEQRAQRRNQWLDRVSPERRAKWAEYRDAIRKRRIELGLPPSPGRGPRGR